MKALPVAWPLSPLPVTAELGRQARRVTRNWHQDGVRQLRGRLEKDPGPQGFHTWSPVARPLSPRVQMSLYTAAHPLSCAHTRPCACTPSPSVPQQPHPARAHAREPTHIPACAHAPPARPQRAAVTGAHLPPHLAHSPCTQAMGSAALHCLLRLGVPPRPALHPSCPRAGTALQLVSLKWARVATLGGWERAGGRGHRTESFASPSLPPPSPCPVSPDQPVFWPAGQRPGPV